MKCLAEEYAGTIGGEILLIRDNQRRRVRVDVKLVVANAQFRWFTVKTRRICVFRRKRFYDWIKLRPVFRQ